MSSKNHSLFNIYKELANKISTQAPNLPQIFAESLSKTVTVTFCNPLSFTILRTNQEYFNNVLNTDYVYADGILLSSLVEKVTGEPCERVSFDGNSIAIEVFNQCKLLDKRVAIIGTEDKYINEATEKLSDKMNIVYHRNGFLKNEQEIDQLIIDLNERKADVVIFGMGAPYQEKMLQILKDKKFIGLAFTCGGYLEQLAKKDILYYPDFINKYNLRSIYRVWDEPGKMLKRYIVDYSSFYKAYVHFFFNRT